MTTEQAIQILSDANGVYGGTFVVGMSDNLIENIINEDIIGETFHRFGAKTIIRTESLIPLAKWEQKQQ
jgi:hypothetical protein